MSLVYTDEERNKWHAHNDLDTIDSCLLMNPSMVTVWPSRTVLNYLKNEEKKYDSVNCEAMQLFNFCDSENLIQARMLGMTEVLKVGGITYDLNSKLYLVREHDDPKDVVKFLEIANDHGFEVVLQIDPSEKNNSYFHDINMMQFTVTRSCQNNSDISS